MQIDLIQPCFYRKEKAETNVTESTNKTDVDEEMTDTINAESAAAVPAEIDQDGDENNNQEEEEEEEDSDDVRALVHVALLDSFNKRCRI